MSILRGIFLLLVFFGCLYLLRDPIHNVGPNLETLVVVPFKAFFENIKTATTTLSEYNVLPSGKPSNAVPTPGGMASSSDNSVKSDTATTSGRTLIGNFAPVLSQDISYSDPSNTPLTRAGVISLTNNERQKLGIGTLTENKRLDASAEAKLEDMFRKQYFEHVSPAGTSVSDLVKGAGYDYIVVGENLALGNFGGDAKVIAAWMASPGHRANILDKRFSEIGIAIGQGMYKGHTQWIAVQHFGKPLSSCIGADDDAKTKIDLERASLAVQEQQITTLRNSIDALIGDAYVKKVNEYNALVVDYNARLAHLKVLITSYNQTVRDFNSCAGLTS